MRSLPSFISLCDIVHKNVGLSSSFLSETSYGSLYIDRERPVPDGFETLDRGKQNNG
jgi:hypothetical protein